MEDERLAQRWIEAMTGEAFAGADFASSLDDGVLLCKLANAVQPKSVPRVNQAKMVFMRLENIQCFLRACREIGQAEYSLFNPQDLVERKDLGSVVTSILALAMVVERLPGWQGPTLKTVDAAGAGPVPPPQVAVTAPAPKTHGRRDSRGLDLLRSALEGDGVAAVSGVGAPSAAAAAAAAPAPALKPWERPPAAAATPSAASVAAPASGGGTFKPSPPKGPAPPPTAAKPWQKKPSPSPPASAAPPAAAAKPWQKKSLAPKSTPAPKPWQAPAPPAAPTAAAAHGGSAPDRDRAELPKYGLDAELAAKRAAKYDSSAEQQAREWIEAVSGERIGSDFGASLRDGVILCMLANAITPGAVKKVERAGAPFRERVNISNFLKFARAIGVTESDLFSTTDLYDGLDVGQVVSCMHSVGRAVQRLPGGWTGPVLGVKEATPAAVSTASKKKWAAHTGATFLTAGSSATMERSAVPKSSGPTFGADMAGASAQPSAVSWVSAGSSATMARSAVPKSSGPTFGAVHSGPSAQPSTASWVSAGSSATMERSAVARSMDPTFGADAAKR